MSYVEAVVVAAAQQRPKMKFDKTTFEESIDDACSVSGLMMMMMMTIMTTKRAVVSVAAASVLLHLVVVVVVPNLNWTLVLQGEGVSSCCCWYCSTDAAAFCNPLLLHHQMTIVR